MKLECLFEASSGSLGGSAVCRPASVCVDVCGGGDVSTVLSHGRKPLWKIGTDRRKLLPCKTLDIP